MSAIDTRLDGQCHSIAVPDQGLNPYKLDHYDSHLRRAVPALELGLGDRVAWELYLGQTAARILDDTALVYGKRFNVTKRQLEARA